MIQAYHKYRPASFEALALLVCADSKDRLAAIYQADMLRMLLLLHIPVQGRNPEAIPRLPDMLFKRKAHKELTTDKATSFVDSLLATFRKGG